MKVREIPSESYGRVIEIRLPTRYYWNKDGTFDGFEMTISKVSEADMILIQEVLQQMQFLIKNNKDWNLKDLMR